MGLVLSTLGNTLSAIFPGMAGGTQSSRNEAVCCYLNSLSQSMACIFQTTQNDPIRLGCGLLIGIDRILVPKHIISNKSINQIKVFFFYGGGEGYDVQSFLCADGNLDFCVLKIMRKISYLPGPKYYFPGNKYPPIGVDRFRKIVGTTNLFFIKIGADLKFSYSIVRIESNGVQFHSITNTTAGDCGGCYFSGEGDFIAMHNGKSTGLCYYEHIRSAITAGTISNHNSFHDPVNIPRCTPTPDWMIGSHYMESFSNNDICFTEEGGRPAVTGSFTEDVDDVEYRVTYWEVHPKNNTGPGPRSIRIVLQKIIKEKKHKKIQLKAEPIFDYVYRIDKNPHQFGEYNNNQKELYSSGAQAFFTKCQENNFLKAPAGFNFYAYNIGFSCS